MRVQSRTLLYPGGKSVWYWLTNQYEWMQNIGNVVAVVFPVLATAFILVSVYINVLAKPTEPNWGYPASTVITAGVLSITALLYVRNIRTKRLKWINWRVVAGSLFTLCLLFAAIYLMTGEAGNYTNPMALFAYIVAVISATFLIPALYQIVYTYLIAFVVIQVIYSQSPHVTQLSFWSDSFAAIMYVLSGTILLAVMNAFRFGVWRYALIAQEALKIAQVALEGEKKQREKAEQAERTKDEFLHVASHELRTPLNAIIGFGESLLNGMEEPHVKDAVTGVVGPPHPLSDIQKGLLDTIVNRSHSLLKLINNMLDAKTLSEGQMRAHIEMVLPDMFVQQCVKRLKGLTDPKGLYLNAVVQGSIPTVNTDRDKLEQIITNIVGNAVKFTEKGGITVTVGSDTETNWYVKIQDTGIGMDKVHLEGIFQKFYQIEEFQTRETKGTGLGLSITKDLVKLLQGKIKVESEVGKGSTFTVTFPVKPVIQSESKEGVKS